MATLIIESNALQVDAVLIADMTVTIPGSGGAESFDEIREITLAQGSINLRDYLVDDAHGPNESTLKLRSPGGLVPQDEALDYLAVIIIDGLVIAPAPTEHDALDGRETNGHPQYGPIENGFEDSIQPTARASTTLTFDDPTLTLTLTPSVPYIVVAEQVRQTISTPLTAVIADVEGFHWFLMNGSATIVVVDGPTIPFNLISTHALVAGLYWDATNKACLRLQDERHGLTMDSATHAYLHRSRGAVYGDGLALGNMDVDGNGNDATAAQLSVQDGTVLDEDLPHLIVGGSPQTLAVIAEIPVFYRDGDPGYWRQFPATQYPVATTGSGRAAWNELVGTTWQVTEAASQRYVLSHIFATGDLVTPVIVIMGQNTYLTAGAARAGAAEELLELQFGPLDALTPEIVPLATVIFQTSVGYSNAVKSRVVSTDTGDDYIDWRGSALGGGAAAAAPTTLPVDAAARDSVNSDLIYIGRSSSATPDTSLAEWQIYVYDSEAALFLPIYADGNLSYDNIWDDRESLTYS